MTHNDPIYVTRPNLPNLASYVKLLSQIWESGTLTNSGPFHNRLENELAKYLDVPHVSLFNNGTIALVVALQALDLPKGSEIITTPFSFVATAHSVVWDEHTPIFVDIDEQSCNINVDVIEDAITEKTSAILGVHCYGNPCDVDALELIAKKYDLKLVYDAAHAFGVEKNGTSVLNYGDLSALSFHATKVFSTIEGGAIVSHSLDTKRKIDRLRNFGFQDETTVCSLGLNGKMSEINAAYGLLQLENIKEAISNRLKIEAIYRSRLQATKGVTTQHFLNNTKGNGSYFPIFISSDAKLMRDEVYLKLKDKNIFARRYFYPLITHMEPYKTDPKYRVTQPLSVANKMANHVLCLPIYPDLSYEQVHVICDYLCEWLTDE